MINNLLIHTRLPLRGALLRRTEVRRYEEAWADSVAPRVRPYILVAPNFSSASASPDLRRRDDVRPLSATRS
jgi:hypothetical protein